MKLYANSRREKVLISVALVLMFLFAFWDPIFNLLFFTMDLIFILFALPGYPVGLFLGKVGCAVYPPNYCIGMGFDGGPLEWLEWLGVFMGGFVFWGIFIWFLYKKFK